MIMNALEAFKELLNGKCITRPEWDGGHISYNKELNGFDFIAGEMSTLVPVRNVFFSHLDNNSSIKFAILSEMESGLTLLDDDLNEIYEDKNKIEYIKDITRMICDYTYRTIGCKSCIAYNTCSKIKKEIKNMNNDELFRLSKALNITDKDKNLEKDIATIFDKNK